MKRKRAILLIFLPVALVGTAWQMLKPTSLDFSKDEEPFRSITHPISEVIGNSYMDGGSVWLRIDDANGRRHDVTFPIDRHSFYNTYPTAFSGTLDHPKKVPLKNPDRAKAIAIQLLKDHPLVMTPPDMETFDLNGEVAKQLSRPPEDLLNRIKWRMVDFLSGL